MFEGPDFPQSLDEELFNSWLENGRQLKLSYNYLVIIWNELELEYQPVYVEDRDAISDYTKNKNSSRELFVAAYDLYSETKII